MAKRKARTETEPTAEEAREKEAAQPDVFQEWVCVEPCYYKSKKYRLGESITSIARPNQNFRPKGGVMPPSKKAASALPQTQQDRIHDLITLCGLKLDEELKKMDIGSLAVFAPADAQVYIEKLSKQYKERGLRDEYGGPEPGPELGPDEKAGEEQAEADQK